MQIIKKTLSYRLKPTALQQVQLLEASGAVRFVYNHNLAKLKEVFDKKEKLPHKYDMCNSLKDLKKEHEFIAKSPAAHQSLQQSIFDLDKALKAFFRRIKTKEGAPGFPRFKSKNIHHTIKYAQLVKVKEHKLVFPKIGAIRYWDSRPIEGTIKQVVVNKRGKHWYAHVMVDVEKVVQITRNEGQRHSLLEGQQAQEGQINNIQPLALHLGLENFAYTSEGKMIENPRFLQRDLKRLQHLQRKHSRKKNGSANRKKSAIKLGRFHERIANRRKDFLHKLSTALVESQDVIIVQKFNTKAMIADTQKGAKKRPLARSIHDVGWSTFLSYLKYKCDWADKRLIEIPHTEPVAMQCAHCGVLKDMPLHKRFYDCEHCGVKVHRGINAVLNIRAAGLAVLNDCGGMSASSPTEAVIS